MCIRDRLELAQNGFVVNQCYGMTETFGDVLISKLSVAVDTFCFGLAKRSYEHRSFILVTSGFGIDNTQFTMLRSCLLYTSGWS